MQNELDAVRAELSRRVSQVDELSAEVQSNKHSMQQDNRKNSPKDHPTAEMDIQNEQQARRDVEVDFAARAADVEQKFVTDTARLQTLGSPAELTSS